MRRSSWKRRSERSGSFLGPLKWILFYKLPNRELAFKVSREFQWILQEW